MTDRKDCKNLFSLIAWLIMPSIYLLIRMQIISVSNADINIMGQIEWFDLIDEMLVTALTMPLYHLLKPERSDKYKNGSVLAISFVIYLLFAIIVSVYMSNLAEYMNAGHAKSYLLMQNIAMLVNFITTFMIMLFLLNGRHYMIVSVTMARFMLLIITDFLFIPKFQDIGAAFSEIVTNLIISIVCIAYAYTNNLISFKNFRYEYLTIWFQKGMFAALSIFLDNFIYMIMICRMVNAVQSSGNYWIANNFIWGWLLIPVMALCEIIKKNNLEKLSFKNTWRPSIIIIIIWIVTMPFWNNFLAHAMAADAASIMPIIMPLVPFYIAYVISSCIDSWLISKGQTKYIAINSICVNILYYGIVYLLFMKNIFALNIDFVISMFGWGMVVHLIISIICYIMELSV